MVLILKFDKSCYSWIVHIVLSDCDITTCQYSILRNKDKVTCGPYLIRPEVFLSPSVFVARFMCYINTPTHNAVIDPSSESKSRTMSTDWMSRKKDMCQDILQWNVRRESKMSGKGLKVRQTKCLAGHFVYTVFRPVHYIYIQRAHASITIGHL